jgi:hypothetical protein
MPITYRCNKHRKGKGGKKIVNFFTSGQEKDLFPGWPEMARGKRAGSALDSRYANIVQLHGKGSLLPV